MRVPVLLALAVALAAGCQCAGRCDGQVCAGCCSASEGCLPGTYTIACGKGGEACVACTSPAVCVENACALGPGVIFGTGSGGGAAGGAGAGGAGAGGAGAGGAGAGGAGAGSTSGGAAGGFSPLPGNLNDEVGRPCTETTDCPQLGGVQLLCLPAQLSPSRKVCQYECRMDGTCANDATCVATSWSGGVCRDCLIPCAGADGGRSTCRALERCIAGPGGAGVCTPDCRLLGALCRSGQCQPNGLCSGNGLVPRCVSW
ncbi:MAG: hypothetical protein JNJ54_21615 [Myxococcaceae bacterium]|nr:hypothetical protein [Myxococcaceae bacterium]